MLSLPAWELHQYQTCTKISISARFRLYTNFMGVSQPATPEAKELRSFKTQISCSNLTGAEYARFRHACIYARRPSARDLALLRRAHWD